jgi:hypothetical protein
VSALKKPGHGQGEVPPSNETAIPRSNVAVNLIGFPQVHAEGRTLIAKAQTVIDVSTTLGEIVHINDSTSKQVAMRFEDSWLARRCPRPYQVIHDQGPEFTAPPLQAVLICNVIDPVPITVKNPQQANATCESFHIISQHQLCTIFRSNPSQDIDNVIDAIGSNKTTTIFASQVAIHQTLGVLPGGIISFQRVLCFTQFPFWRILN